MAPVTQLQMLEQDLDLRLDLLPSARPHVLGLSALREPPGPVSVLPQPTRGCLQRLAQSPGGGALGTALQGHRGGRGVRWRQSLEGQLVMPGGRDPGTLVGRRHSCMWPVLGVVRAATLSAFSWSHTVGADS